MADDLCQFVENQIDDADVKSGERQEMGGAAFPEEGCGFARKPAPLSGEEGFEKRGGFIGPERDGVDQAPEPFHRPAGIFFRETAESNAGLGSVPGAEHAQNQECQGQDGRASGRWHAHQAVVECEGENQQRKQQEGEDRTGSGEPGPCDDACRKGDGQRFYAFRFGHTCEISNNFVSLHE